MTLALHGKPKQRQWLLVAFALLAVVVGAAGAVIARPAAADHGTSAPTSGEGTVPFFVPLTGNEACSDLAGHFAIAGTSWSEIKFEGAELTDPSTKDGVTISNFDTDGGFTFDWTSTVGIDAVFVKQASNPGDSNIYVYQGLGANPGAENKNDTGLGTANGATGVSHISFCYDAGDPDPPQATLTVSKTADTRYTRTHDWSIDKKVETENDLTHNDLPKIWLYTDGSGDESATWTIDVTYEDFVDSGFEIYGTITISNPNDDPVTINSVDDALGGGFGNADVLCEDDAEAAVVFPHVLASLGVIDCTYNEAVDAAPGDSGTNTVTVGWTDPEGAAQEDDATDDWAFGAPTTEVDKTVTIKDKFGGDAELTLGTATAPNNAQFTYTKDYEWADYGADGCGDFRYTNVARIVETGDSATATLLVNVQCFIYETAFAMENGGRCFLQDGFDRWGWTNQIARGTDETWNVYAGAGQCDLSKGTLVGTVHVVFNSATGVVTVTFDIEDEFDLQETHVYVGTNDYPKKKGVETVAPGQYTNGSPFATATSVYVIAHAVVGIPDPNFGP